MGAREKISRFIKRPKKRIPEAEEEEEGKQEARITQLQRQGRRSSHARFLDLKGLRRVLPRAEMKAARYSRLRLLLTYSLALTLTHSHSLSLFRSFDIINGDVEKKR